MAALLSAHDPLCSFKDIEANVAPVTAIRADGWPWHGKVGGDGGEGIHRVLGITLHRESGTTLRAEGWPWHRKVGGDRGRGYIECWGSLCIENQGRR